MNCRPSVRVVIACLALLVPLVLPALAAAQDQPQRANILVTVSGTMRDGSAVMKSSTSSGWDSAAKIGETQTRYFYTTANGILSGASEGKPPEAYLGTGGSAVRATVVGGAVVTTSVDPGPLHYDYLWQVDVKPVSIATDVVTFELDWKRTDVKDGARQVAAGDHRTIRLHQGEKHLLDFIPCPPDAHYANVFLSVEASPVEDPSVANLGFSYDLWLVHRTSEGAKVTRHALVTGRQGEKVKFDFAALPLPLDTGAAPDSDSPFKLYVSGTIAARQKADGTIDVALQPKREQHFWTGSVGYGAGIKTFETRPDETTSVSLPAGNGFSSRRGVSFPVGSPRPGVTVANDTVRVDLKSFFEGTETSILVTVHREK